jgi:hypothetical protein
MEPVLMVLLALMIPGLLSYLAPATTRNETADD